LQLESSIRKPAIDAPNDGSRGGLLNPIDTTQYTLTYGGAAFGERQGHWLESRYQL